MGDKQKSPFTTDDYNSGDGMITYIWGPAMWLFLHTTSFNYPVIPSESDKKHYYKFFKNLQNILPCRYCRENYAENIKKIHKLTYGVMKNRETLSRWVFELHEIINERLGKKSGLSYEDVRDRYEHFRSRCLLDPEEIIKGEKGMKGEKEKGMKGEKEKGMKGEKEKGCTDSLYGLKSKCVINIIPRNNRSNSFKMDPKCIIKKGKNKL